MRLFMVLLILAFISLQYKLWFGDGSLLQWWDLEQKLVAQEEGNKKLATRNHALEADILELKSGEQALEERARSELGMIKEGETYYHFVQK